MQLTICPLTPDLWPAFADLFGDKGACTGCWCMYWRVGAAYRKRPLEENKAAFRKIVNQGPPPGLIAFDGDVAVGWCQLTSRDALPWLDYSWRLRRVDAVPVRSLSCFYVRIGYRKRGITSALIKAAIKAAKRSQGPGPRSLSVRRGQNAQRFRHRVRDDIRTRGVQNCCLPRAVATDHAP